MKNIVTGFLVLFLLACNSKQNTPDGILNEDQMVSVVVEVELKQAMYKLKFASTDSINYNQLIAFTFKQQNTTKEQFNNSLVYYAKTPVVLKQIYDKALIALTEKQAAIQLNVDK